jgi:Putative Flp pilus-assembly TadE/G-like
MRTYLRSFVQRLREFTRAEGGMTLPLLAFSMITITGVTGMAVDMARAQMVQSKLQFSLDAAGLAAGSTVSTANLNAEVSKYLNSNFNNYLGATITGTSVTATNNNTVFNLYASAEMPTTFMNVLGVKHIDVHANSQISRAITGLELVMVLDNTGSMANKAGGSGSKIQALQSAANTLVTTLFNGQSTSTNGKLWVGIVPFSQTVNIGTTGVSGWLNTNSNNGIFPKGNNNIDVMPFSQGPGWGPTAWGGCVDARPNGEDVTDDPPSQSNVNTLFDKYYWPSDSFNYGTPFNNKLSGITGNNTWATKIYNRCQVSKPTNCTSVNNSCSTSGSGGPYTCTVTGYSYSSPLNTTQQGPNYLCPQQVTPMTNVASTLTTSINAMQPEGNTEINQGLQWGWFMLSPRWRGLWGGTMGANNLPLDYNTRGMIKALVLVTDGENTIDNGSHGSYWYLANKMLGTTNGTTAVNDLNAKTTAICNAMKANGIYIYTIALGTDPSPADLALLQSCATASNYYFDSPSTSQLQGFFSAIGDSLASLRVSQ